MNININLILLLIILILLIISCITMKWSIIKPELLKNVDIKVNHGIWKNQICTKIFEDSPCSTSDIIFPTGKNLTKQDKDNKTYYTICRIFSILSIILIFIILLLCLFLQSNKKFVNILSVITSISILITIIVYLIKIHNINFKTSFNLGYSFILQIISLVFVLLYILLENIKK